MKLKIEVDIFDAGCLPGLLRDRIAEVERRLLPRDPTIPSEVRWSLGTYLSQLNECLRAVEAARQRIRDTAE
jgi:hypothetical protein